MTARGTVYATEQQKIKTATTNKIDDLDATQAVIDLGTEPSREILLREPGLSQGSEYFAQFDRDGWPARFVLQKDPNVALCIAVPDHGDVAEAPPGHDHEYVACLNHKLLRLLVMAQSDLTRQSTEEDDHPTWLLDITRLAQSYGCMETVRARILLAVTDWRDDDEQIMREEPLAFLEIAYLLKHRTLFNAALSHAAGQWAAGLLDRETELPPGLRDIVQETASTLSERVAAAMQQMKQPVALDTALGAPASFAMAFFHQHVLNRVISTQPGSVECCDELKQLSNPDIALDMLDSPQVCNLWEALGVIDKALASAEHHVEKFSMHRHEFVEESRVLSKLRTGSRQKLSRSVIRPNLGRILGIARGVLEPVLRGDPDVYYFTFIHHEGPMLWELAEVP